MGNRQRILPHTNKEPVHIRRNVEAFADPCPACGKVLDRVPGGVLKITGSFIWDHKEEILNLVRNEGSKALSVNPLERIMSLQSDDGEIEITTTNEKLAERIGRALHKAYRGTVEYTWSADTRLARVMWHRNS